MIADLILVSVTPTAAFTTVKVVNKFTSFATAHALKNKTVDVISENLFECLPFLE